LFRLWFQGFFLSLSFKGLHPKKLAAQAAFAKKSKGRIIFLTPLAKSCRLLYT
jgi:hypothetical protein